MLEDFFKKYAIDAEDSLVIACSGGPDSMFLLSEISKAMPKKRMIVAHFNHCLRGDESDADEDFLHDFCVEQGLLFMGGGADIGTLARETKKSIEETARIARYEFLENIRQEYGAKYILTGHHLDDSIETLLFHFIRGSKISGLMGIPEQNQNILRPFLSVTKQEILKTLEKEKIPYRIDSTNADETYLRNHLRRNILPEFERINPEYRRNLHSFMGYMAELHAHLDLEVHAFLGDDTSFSVALFQELSPFLKREIIRYLYQKCNS